MSYRNTTKQQSTKATNALNGPKVFLVALFAVVGLFYGSILAYHRSTPRSSTGVPVDFMDTCREICLNSPLK